MCNCLLCNPSGSTAVSQAQLPSQGVERDLVVPSCDADITEQMAQALDTFVPIVETCDPRALRSALRGLYCLGHAHGILDARPATVGE